MRQIELRDVRKCYALWLEREELLEELCSSSDIGYPGCTAEASAGEGKGDGHGGTKVPVRALDALRRCERAIEDIMAIMRVIPVGYEKVLREDYLGGVERGEGYQRHRRELNKAVEWWRGACAMQQKGLR